MRNSAMQWGKGLLIGTLLTVGCGVIDAAPTNAPVAATIAPDAPSSMKPIRGIITPRASGWEEIKFVNVRTYPFDGTLGSSVNKPPLGSTSKTIFQSPEAPVGSELPIGQLIHLEYQPTFKTEMPKPGGAPHYHTFWEWGYALKGDSIMMEPVSPNNMNGFLYRKREGGWLTRQPFGLHGGSLVTGGGRNQLPYELVIFEEGDGHVIGVGRNGAPGTYRGRDGKGPPPGMKYSDYREVPSFSRPWLLDSQADVDWEDDKAVKGRFVKWLDDDMQNGFRSQLVKIPPGWTPPSDFKKTFNETANVFRYMVWGDMNVWVFANSADAGKAYRVGDGYFIYQPPRAIWGYGDGQVTSRGAIWLEVTYSKGLKHDKENGPIEKPKQVM